MAQLKPKDPSLLAHGAAGAVSSVAASALLYPLEQIRTLQQLGIARRVASEKNRKRYGERIGCIVDCFEDQGVSGLYRGLMPSLFALGVSNFIFYFVFQGMRQMTSKLKMLFILQLKKYGRLKFMNKSSQIKYSNKNVFEDLITSMLAGVINVFLTNPLWVVVTRMKKQTNFLTQGLNGKQQQQQEDDDENTTGIVNKKTKSKREVTIAHKGMSGMVQLMHEIAEREGCGSLWTSGLSASLMLVSNPVIHFAVYEGLKRTMLIKHRNGTNQVLTPSQGFLIGGVAKTIATVLTYPIQVAQVKLRAENTEESNSAWSIIQRLWYSEGLGGLFQGIESKIIQSALTSALIFGSYEAVLGFFIHFSTKRNAVTSRQSL